MGQWKMRMVFNVHSRCSKYANMLSTAVSPCPLTSPAASPLAAPPSQRPSSKNRAFADVTPPDVVLQLRCITTEHARHKTTYTKMAKEYNSDYSPGVTYLTTNPLVPCLSTAERTGSASFKKQEMCKTGWPSWRFASKVGSQAASPYIAPVRGLCTLVPIAKTSLS
jgi:hypothetical protein